MKQNLYKNGAQIYYFTTLQFSIFQAQLALSDLLYSIAATDLLDSIAAYLKSSVPPNALAPGEPQFFPSNGPVRDGPIFLSCVIFFFPIFSVELRSCACQHAPCWLFPLWLRGGGGQPVWTAADREKLLPQLWFLENCPTQSATSRLFQTIVKPVIIHEVGQYV